MQIQSILSIFLLAAPLAHAIALPQDNLNLINNKLEVRVGDTKAEADRLEKQHTEACQRYRTCLKACQTSSGYMTASGKLKESAKKPMYEKCVKKSCDPINEQADALLLQWKEVDSKAKKNKCVA